MTKLAVRKSILSSFGPFQRICLQARMDEAEDHVIKLSVDDPVAVKAMVCCMYQYWHLVRDGRPQGERHRGRYENSIRLIRAKLFVLGEKYQMPKSRNHVIAAIIHRSEKEDCFAIRNNYMFMPIPGMTLPFARFSSASHSIYATRPSSFAPRTNFAEALSSIWLLSLSTTLRTRKP